MKTRFNCLVVGVLIPLLLTSSLAQKPNVALMEGAKPARLTIQGGSSATVNGASAGSGVAVFTGATIETPANVSANLDLGQLGTIDLSPKSSVRLDFTDDGNVRIQLLGGCVMIKKKGAGNAEVYTAEGASEKTRSNSKAMGFCYADGQLNPSGVRASNAGVKRRKVKFPWCVFVLKC